MSSGDAVPAAAFQVHLEIFEGPFDLLLSLIARKQLDVTLVALSQVTDEFLAHIRAGAVTGTSTRRALSWWWRPPCST